MAARRGLYFFCGTSGRLTSAYVVWKNIHEFIYSLSLTTHVSSHFCERGSSRIFAKLPSCSKPRKIVASPRTSMRFGCLSALGSASNRFLTDASILASCPSCRMRNPHSESAIFCCRLLYNDLHTSSQVTLASVTISIDHGKALEINRMCLVGEANANSVRVGPYACGMIDFTGLRRMSKRMRVVSSARAGFSLGYLFDRGWVAK